MKSLPIEISAHRIENLDKVAWDQRVASVPSGTFAQTTINAEMRKAMFHDDAIFLTFHVHGELVAQFLLMIGFSSAMEMGRWSLGAAALPWASRMLPSGVWLRGPLIFRPSLASDVLEHILCYVEDNFTPKLVGIQNASLPLDMVDDRPLMEAAGELFRRFSYEGRPWATFFVGLRHTPQKLWSTFHASARKNIKKCEREGVEVIEATTEEHLRLYHDMRVETHLRGGPVIDSFDRLAASLEHLTSANCGCAFIAMKGESPVAGLVITHYNGWIEERGVAYSNLGIRQGLHGSDLIKWHIIQWGHKNGYHTYNLAGVNPNPISTKEKNIFRFKKKWGGELIPYAEYTKVLRPGTERVIRFFRGGLRRLGIR